MQLVEFVVAGSVMLKQEDTHGGDPHLGNMNVPCVIITTEAMLYGRVLTFQLVSVGPA